MARFGDKGPYAIGNVKIISTSNNNSEGAKGRPLSAEHCAKISKLKAGGKLTEEHKQAISKSLKGHNVSKKTRLAISMAQKGVPKPRLVAQDAR